MALAHGVGDFKTFPCDFCDKVLGQKSHLEEHMVSVHGMGDKFTCNICSRVLASKRVLKAHMDRLHPSH